MSSISVLAEAEAEQLRAGWEVSHGTGQVAAELTLNALEAGASRVELELNPRQASARCTDNGCGIAPDDVRTRLCRPGCSGTPRGRGRSLACIVRAAEWVEIETRKHGRFTSIRAAFHHGTLVQTHANASRMRSPGTSVAVSHLLYNTPARRMCLLARPGEQKQAVRSQLARLALAFPNAEIQAHVSESNETLLCAERGRSVLSTLSDVQCAQLANDMATIAQSDTKSQISLTGYVARYPAGTASPSCQYIFLNARPVTVPFIERRITQWFKELAERDTKHSPTTAPTHQNPAYVLFLSAPTEVCEFDWGPDGCVACFKEPNYCEALIKQALAHQAWSDQVSGKQLSQVNRTLQCTSGGDTRRRVVNPYNNTSFSSRDRINKYTQPQVCNSSGDCAENSVSDAPAATNSCERRSVDLPLSVHDACRQRPEENIMQNHLEPSKSHEPKNSSPQPPVMGTLDCGITVPNRISGEFIRRCTTIAQVDQKFLLTSDEQMLVALDQHACDERVRLEHFWSEFRAQRLSQAKALVDPIHIDVEPSEAAAIMKSKASLERLGWRIDEWSESDRGRERRSVRAVPSILGTELGVDSLIEHLNDVRERGEHAAERSPKAVARLLAEKACKGAKKFNQRLEPVKQQEVVSRLGECELPMHCAHGRPTSVPLVSLRSLQRKRARGRRQKRPTLRRAKKQIAEGGSATEAERWR